MYASDVLVSPTQKRDSELAFIYRKLSSFVAVSVFLPYLLPWVVQTTIAPWLVNR